MKLSLFMMPLHQKEKPYPQQLAEDMEAFVYADQLGYAEAWCGEHFSTTTEPITSPLLFFSNLIARTKQIKFATGVACLPQYHPAIYAGHAALFDHLSGGRFIFGIGTGGLQSDFELFGTLDKDRAGMLREAIDTILTLWATDPPYDIKGKFWNTRIVDWHIDHLGLGHMAKPLQKPHPPIAITAASANSPSMKAAGRRGWIPVSANFIGAWAVKTHWNVYAAEAEKAGFAPDREIWRVARSIFVAESDAEAEEFVRRDGGAYDHYFWYLHTLWTRGGILGAYLPTPTMKAEELTSHQQLRDSFVIHGSPRTVVDKLMAFREEVGHFGHLLLTAHDWVDRPRQMQSMGLMAEKVLPAINAAIGARPIAAN